MDLSFLPNELLEMLISYMDIQDAKRLSQTSKRMYQLTLSRIWSKPSFKVFKTPDFLQKISKFPVKCLGTRSFQDCFLMMFEKSFPQLDKLYVNSSKNFKVEDFDKVGLRMILHTEAIQFTPRTHYFTQIMKILTSTDVKQLYLNHDVDYLNERNGRLSLDQLEELNQTVPIVSLSVDCIDVNENNLAQFIKVLAGFKNCEVSMTYITNEGRYLFTVEDLESMVEHDIKVTYIMSDALKTDGLSENFGLFAPVLKQMKYLEDFYFTQDPLEGLDCPPPVHLLTDIPIQSITTNDFVMDKQNIKNIVNTLSKMKSLQRLDIYSSEITGYKLSPEELSLFKDFPIRDIDDDALDLKKENSVKFRQILSELKDLDCNRLFEIIDEISE